MRGKVVIWGMACALLATTILPVLAGGALAQDCTTVSATLTSDHGARREVCLPGGSGGSPGDIGDPAGAVWGTIGDPGQPPGDAGLVALVQDLVAVLGEVEHSFETCGTIFETDNGDRDDSEVTVCAHAGVRVPTEGNDRDVSTESCEVQDREGADPAVQFGDGGVAACAAADVRPGGLVGIDTDDCPSDDPGDPTIFVGDESIQICPGDIYDLMDLLLPNEPDLGDDDDDSDDGDSDDPISAVPPLPSNDEGVYSMIGDAADSAGDFDPTPGGSVPSTHVDDERCSDDMVGDTSVHVGSWTVWVCVHDPTA